ncbi:MAG: ABC transporter ATP-binding protein [Granulosicoccaceae bacterium]|jgi:molybdate transport system ATP-binding protein
MNELSIRAQLKRGGFRLNVDLQIPGQGVTAIIGPSGSGKSSLLRLIAGLERPQYGCLQAGDTVWVDSDRKVCLPPQQRKAGVVFQDYALFEHMNVAQNIAYGVTRRDRDGAVRHWIQRLQLQGLEQHYPSRLSGGQRQRVALARALAPQPDILLLDEPFSAVDAHLRQTLRTQIKQLIHDLQQPVLIISHDLEDVRHMADNIGVMIDGRIRRFANATEVFEQPCSHEVARVLGWRNFLYVHRLEHSRVSGAWGSIELEEEVPIDTYCLAIRPEHVRLAPSAGEGLRARVEQVIELGAVREMECRLQDGSIIVLHRPWNEPLPAAGSEVRLYFPLQHLRALPERRAPGAVPDGLPGKQGSTVIQESGVCPELNRNV